MPTTEGPTPAPTGEEVAKAAQALGEALAKVLNPIIRKGQAMRLFGLAYTGETETLGAEFAKLDEGELRRLQAAASTLRAAVLMFRAGRPIPVPKDEETLP